MTDAVTLLLQTPAGPVQYHDSKNAYGGSDLQTEINKYLYRSGYGSSWFSELEDKAMVERTLAGGGENYWDNNNKVNENYDPGLISDSSGVNGAKLWPLSVAEATAVSELVMGNAPRGRRA